MRGTSTREIIRFSLTTLLVLRSFFSEGGGSDRGGSGGGVETTAGGSWKRRCGMARLVSKGDEFWQEVISPPFQYPGFLF